MPNPNLALLFCLLALPAAANRPLAEEKTIAVGIVERLDFDFQPSAKSLIGNNSVLEIAPVAGVNRIDVIPLKIGTASLLVFDENGKQKFVEGDIVFDNVSFKYPKSEGDVLSGLSLTIKQNTSNYKPYLKYYNDII